jgi:hypothetical protein
VVSIAIITIGCLLASVGDIEFDGFAYMAGVTCVFAQAGYLTLIEMASAIEAFSKTGESQVSLTM